MLGEWSRPAVVTTHRLGTILCALPAFPTDRKRAALLNRRSHALLSLSRASFNGSSKQPYTDRRPRRRDKQAEHPRPVEAWCFRGWVAGHRRGR
jgi:hypothetical protein